MSELRVGDLAWAAIPETRMVGQSSSKLTWLGGKSAFFLWEIPHLKLTASLPRKPQWLVQMIPFLLGQARLFTGLKC